ncbi:MAG: hypothetical protein RR537_08590 [Longicatena sp.]
MKIKHDDCLVHLRNFGFVCEENTSDGFMRYCKRVGDLLITVANGQFENKIRVSMLQDKEGNIRTSYKDVIAFSDLICELQEARLTQPLEIREEVKEEMIAYEEFSEMENPLVMLPRKPAGFML